MAGIIKKIKDVYFSIQKITELQCQVSLLSEYLKELRLEEVRKNTETINNQINNTADELKILQHNNLISSERIANIEKYTMGEENEPWIVNLKQSKSLVEYCKLLQDQVTRFLIVLSVKDTCGLALDDIRAKALQSLKLNSDLSGKHGQAFIGIIWKGESFYEKLSGKEGTITYKNVIEDCHMEITSSVYREKNIAEININGKRNLAVDSRGVNIVVYDLKLNRVVDSVCFDTHIKTNVITRKNDYERRFNENDKNILELNKKIEELQNNQKLLWVKNELLLWGIIRKGSDDETAKREFFLGIPKAEGILRKVQYANLITLCEFDRVCRMKKIKYWLSFGALIGAVRHKGFIPWDDDIDVCVMREELPKIKAAFEGNDIFDFKSFANESRTNICNKLHYKCGGAPYDLDIFVYDYCMEINNDIIAKHIELKEILISEIQQYKARNNGNISVEDAEKIIGRYIEKSKTELNLVDSIEDAKAIIWGIDNFKYGPARASSVLMEQIFPLEEIELEGKYFMAPKNSERYLNKMYGDIYSLPNDIVSHTHFNLKGINLEILDNIINTYGTDVFGEK